MVSEPNYHTKNLFSENLLATEMRKTNIITNKPVYLRLSILELSIKVMYEFWCDYVKPTYGERAKLCYMDTDVETLKNGLTFEIMSSSDQYQKEK